MPVEEEQKNRIISGEMYDYGFDLRALILKNAKIPNVLLHEQEEQEKYQSYINHSEVIKYSGCATRDCSVKELEKTFHKNTRAVYVQVSYLIKNPDELETNVISILTDILNQREKVQNQNNITIIFYARINQNHFFSFACNTNGEKFIFNSLVGYDDYHQAAMNAMRYKIEAGYEAIIILLQKNGLFCGPYTVEAVSAIDFKKSLQEQEIDIQRRLDYAVENQYEIRQEHYKILNEPDIDFQNFTMTNENQNILSFQNKTISIIVTRNIEEDGPISHEELKDRINVALQKELKNKNQNNILTFIFSMQITGTDCITFVCNTRGEKILFDSMINRYKKRYYTTVLEALRTLTGDLNSQICISIAAGDKTRRTDFIARKVEEAIASNLTLSQQAGALEDYVREAVTENENRERPNFYSFHLPQNNNNDLMEQNQKDYEPRSGRFTPR